MTYRRNFTEQDIEKICFTIDTWEKRKLTWNDICKECESFLGYVPTRQGLQVYEAIYDSYTTKKRSLRKGNKRIPSTEIMMATNLRLKKEIQNLEAQKKAIAETIEILRSKAIDELGLSEKQLFMPMPKVDRSILRQRSQRFKKG